MALRGHRQSIEPDDPGTNPGNFIALLKLQSEKDKILHEHLTAPMMRNATYIRADSQNEKINVIGHKIIQEDILAEICEANFQAVMADEIRSHNDEIMSICIRLIEKNKNIRKEFL